MKILLVCAAIAMAAGFSAADVKHIAETDPRVKAAEAVIVEERVILAVIPQPLYTQTARNQLIFDLQQLIYERFGLSDVTVTFDIHVYYALKKG